MSKLRVLPLGGLGEIGKNMTVVEYEDRIVVVDTGLRFPTADMLGIDLVLPDFAYLRERADDIEAIVVTHGHEDHLGALPWVLRELHAGGDIPVLGGPLTIAMARSKLDEHNLRDVDLEDVAAGEQLQMGPFSLELIHMTHSIPDSCAVAVGTDLGTVLLTGDYKFDQTPVDGQPADVSRLAELGSEGVLLLCGDSTNADRPGFSPSERDVGPHLEEVFSRAEGRIVVTSFASNIHRVQQVIDAAAALGRKVALVGRSMRKNVNIGRSLGHIEVPEGMMIQPHEVEDWPDHKVVVISTGSQGEPLSALRRMAYDDHRQITLHRGDTVVFSATPIPGNERAVGDTVDRLYHIGCSVITPREAPIHASGHGFVEELKLMLNLVRPRYVMPIHGDHKRIHLHAQLADAVGIDPDAVFPLENGLPLEIDGPGAVIGERRGRRDDLRGRRRHRRPGRRGPTRSPHALGRRHLHRGGHRLGADGRVRRAARSHLPRRPVHRAGRRARLRYPRGGRAVPDGGGPGGRTGDRPAPAGPARRSGGVRLRPAAAPADGPAGRRRGLSRPVLGGSAGRRRDHPGDRDPDDEARADARLGHLQNDGAAM